MAWSGCITHGKTAVRLRSSNARWPRHARRMGQTHPMDQAVRPALACMARAIRPFKTRRKAMLEIEHLTRRFGGLVAVDDVSTVFEQGKINAIIGPNGAGKTTFFNLINGTFAP